MEKLNVQKVYIVNNGEIIIRTDYNYKEKEFDFDYIKIQITEKIKNQEFFKAHFENSQFLGGAYYTDKDREFIGHPIMHISFLDIEDIHKKKIYKTSFGETICLTKKTVDVIFGKDVDVAKYIYVDFKSEYIGKFL